MRQSVINYVNMTTSLWIVVNSIKEVKKIAYMVW